jgi:protein-tyrosine phosphatase
MANHKHRLQKMDVRLLSFEEEICKLCEAVTREITLNDLNEQICANCRKDDIVCTICHRNITDEENYQSGICKICKLNFQVSKITDGLFLSNQRVSKNYDNLKSIGIKQILSVGAELDIHITEDFKTMRIDIHDSPDVNIRTYFRSAHQFINTAPTLVHCYAGISRSTTIVISYLIRYHNMSSATALNYCKERRPIINPNYGFLEQLSDYEDDYEAAKTTGAHGQELDDLLEKLNLKVKSKENDLISSNASIEDENNSIPSSVHLSSTDIQKLSDVLDGKIDFI